MNRIKTFARSIIIVFTCLLSIACKKDGESKLFPAHFTCEVDGVLYRGNMPYLAPPGAKRNPYISYTFNENYKGFYFYSGIGLIDEDKNEPSSYVVSLNIPLEEPLEKDKEYFFTAIPDEDYGMPLGYSRKYAEKGLPYCSVYADGQMNHLCFGTGKLVIDTFTGEKGSTGSIEFTVPSPLPEDEGKILTFKGRFEHMGIQEE